MPRLVAVIILILLIGLVSGPVSADSSEIVRIGVHNTPPLIFMDTQGDVQGIFPEILEHIAAKENWTLSYVPCTYATCLSQLEAGQLDLLPGVPALDDQPHNVTFSNEPILTNWGQVISSADHQINHIADLDRLTVAAIQGDSHGAALQNLAGEIDIAFRLIELESTLDVVTQVMSGSVDAGLINRTSMQYYEQYAGLSSGSMLVFNPNDVQIIAPGGRYAAHLRVIDHHVSEMKAAQTSVYYDTLNRWLAQDTVAIPLWLIWVLIIGTLVILSFFVGNTLLRRQIEKNTGALQQRTRELESLLETTRDLAEIRDLNDLLDHIAQHTIELLEADEAILFRMEADNTLVPSVMKGNHTEETMNLRIPVGTGITGYCVAHNKSTIANDAQNDSRAYQAPGTMIANVEHVMVASLVFRDRVTGALWVNRIDKPGFTPDNLRMLTALAQHCSTAIENSRLYHELETHNDSLEELVAERTQALQEANDDLFRMSKMKDEFVSNVSHELRTPIASLKLRRYLLAKQPEQLEDHLGVVQREIQRLEEIVEDLLYLSRLDQGRIAINMETVDLNTLVTEMGTDRTLLATERDLDLCIKIDPALPETQADQRLIGQVLSILLTNALNYTPGGGTIQIQTLKHGNNGQTWTGFSVSDNGPGIPYEEQEQLFERFYRGSTALNSGRPGTGLGLSIAREIIDRHDGRITIDSDGIPGKGCTFTVLLPPIPAQ